MSLALCALPGNAAFAARLGAQLCLAQVRLEVRRFPDGETYVRFRDDPAGRQLAFVCSLNDPDAKLQALLFAAGTARELGAAGAGLVAPYLAYMRQDRRFRDGEAVTSALFAGQLSGAFDWLITVDAHLHRRKSLAEIYSIPARDVSAAAGVAAWIGVNVENPLIVGPDSESERWAAAIAAGVGAPHVTLRKVRSGDREVRIEAPDLGAWRGRTPVLVDDIISTARTMAAAAQRLQELGFAPPCCIGVHGVFAGDALESLQGAGVSRIVTSNTIAHETNAIDVSMQVAAAVELQMINQKPENS